MLYYTGCRRGEALATTPNKIDYSEKAVFIQTLKQREGNSLPRYVELPENFLEDLHNVYDVRRKQGPKHGDTRLWGFTGRTAWNYVDQVMREAKITGTKASPKGLRHSMGVALAVDKVPLHTIQQILGHRHIQSTQIYTMVAGEERRGMISRTW